MRLTEIGVEGYRNLVDTRLVLAPGTTVLLGDNGQGKTNLLEAIGVLATTRSFRRAGAQELARHGARTWSVAGRVEEASGGNGLAVAHADGRRTTRVDGHPVELADYIGRLDVVPITQAHAGIVRGAPQERRDFLDRGVLGIRPAYLRTLARYRRTLKQKNALLRAGASARTDELEAWSERLCEDGAEVTLARRAYLVELRAALDVLAPTFLPAGESLELRLEDVVSGGGAAGRAHAPPDVPDRAEVLGALRARLHDAEAREVAQRTALVGPHRDDLSLTLGGRDLRKFASSGQQRNALLALKLAKVEVYRSRRGETPVLLVDDVDTEIDRRRLARFLEHVGGRAQAVLTSSKRDLFDPRPSDVLAYRVERGVIEPF